MRAIPLRAALRVPTILINVALLVALQEVGALVAGAAATQALEVVVAVVGVQLLAVQAHRWVHAGVG
jgi:hypothetical protein